MTDTLDKIAAEAAIEENAAQAAQDAAENPEQEQQVDPAQVWAQIPKMFGGLLSMAMPELKEAYNDKNCLAWGMAMASVGEKYGWDANETLGRFGPEISLVVATIPLALPTVMAIRARREKAKKEKPIDVEVKPAKEEPKEGGGFSEPQ